MGNRKLILCDTNILIHLFRGNEAMKAELDELGFSKVFISSVSIAEIYFGMKKGEERKTKELLRKFTTVHLSKEISVRFLEIMQGYKKHNPKIPDSIIAATAQLHNLELFTLNRKDFDFIKGVKLYNPSRSFIS